jgi:hypothetical protein
MTRFKKELRRLGVKLESDYPWLPFEGIQAVTVVQEYAQVGIHHTGISTIWQMGRDGKLYELMTY